MLGSTHDAEDVVAEAVLRWHRLPEAERAAVREPLAWLTTVVSRLCLDQLRSARARREQTAGVWLPEPRLSDPLAPAGPPDPADVVTLDDTVSFAFLVALERLSPAERVSFLLHDVFGVSFAEIAEVVGRTPAACRQLATSARRHVREERRYDVADAERDRVVRAFLDACRGGDLDRLVGLLDPDVTSVADGGVHVRVARRPVVGAATVARYLLGVMTTQRRLLGVDPEATVEPVNGRSGIVIRLGDTVLSTIDLAVRDGLVTRLYLQVDPEKLAP
ncbi:RNA polymerase subunit sigma-24 [Blastococcus sp. TF02A-26]|nr:RNA polymerase subunit sigma-24 [Blastococcus sp. TF02A-26]